MADDFSPGFFETQLVRAKMFSLASIRVALTVLVSLSSYNKKFGVC